PTPPAFALEPRCGDATAIEVTVDGTEITPEEFRTVDWITKVGKHVKELRDSARGDIQGRQDGNARAESGAEPGEDRKKTAAANAAYKKLGHKIAERSIASYLPRLPANDYKIIIRPKCGLALTKVPNTRLSEALFLRTRDVCSRRHVAPSLTSSVARWRTPSALLPRRAESGGRLSSSQSWPPHPRRREAESRPVPVGLPHLAPASKWVFGELLQECRHGMVVTFDHLLKEIGARACIKLSESPDSELFCVVGNWRRSVIKGAALRTTTTGLSRLRTAYCVWGKYPEMLTSACRSFRERNCSGIVTDDGHNLSLPYVVLHMTFAGWPLSNATLESPLQLWSVVQQVALTLAVAEEALEFEHRALSEDHVLVKKAHHDVLSYRLNGRVLHVHTFGVHAFLVDFCASRLRLRGDVKPLFTNLKKMPRSKCEAMGETFLKICHLVGDEPWLYCPKTNVAGLEALTRRLAKRFESRFAAAVDEAEQEAWCDLCFWLDEMPYCASATELALQMAM
ncbi:hypothetical protein MRX96_038999, partial [Rhipicephalus microplus]